MAIADDIRSEKKRMVELPSDSGVRDRFNELLIAEKVSRAVSIDGLKMELQYLENLGAVFTSSKNGALTASDIQQTLDVAAQGGALTVTRKYGLRDKIKELRA